MIPQIGLDDETFAGIVEKALREIPGLYPEWTDYNAHDPGITLLELIAWQKEMQQFHLDQIGEAHLRGFLNLMGITPRGMRPAEAILSVSPLPEPVFLPKGSRFFADEICFETTGERWIDTAEVQGLACRKKHPDADVGGETAVTKKKLRFPAFGLHPCAGDTLELILSGPLAPGITHSLYLHFYADASAKRKPITDDAFLPLAEYTLSYLTADGPKNALVCEDTTHELLQDGFVTFLTGQNMRPGEDGLYRLSLTLDKSAYDMPPVIEEISLRRLRVRQTCTLIEHHAVSLAAEEYFILRTRLAYEGDVLFFVEREGRFSPYRGPHCRKRGREGVMFCLPGIQKTRRDEVLRCLVLLYDKTCKDRIVPGEGTGMPWEEFPTEIPGLLRESFRVLAEDGGFFPDQYRFFTQTDDFSTHGPEDPVFDLDEKTGTLLFGDCDHGLAPEGQILIAAAQTCVGAKGNVKAGSICRTEPLPRRFGEQPAVTNGREAAGGKDPEEIRTCKNRLLREAPARAVTYQDYEELLKNAPGLLIENARVIPATQCRIQGIGTEAQTVAIVVKPCSLEQEPVLSEPFRQNLLRILDPLRMIGTKLVILSPAYIGITVFAEIRTATEPTAARKQIDRTLSDYFSRIRSQFGIRISHSDLYGALDVLACVSEIRSFDIDAQGREMERSRTGDLLLPVNGLAYLKECHLIVSFGAGQI